MAVRPAQGPRPRSQSRRIHRLLLLPLVALLYAACIPRQVAGRHGAMAPWGATDAPRMFAGFYQAYSHPAAVDRVLYLFRQWYPRSRVLMVNDGGDKVLRQVADKYNAEYWYVHKVKDHGEPENEPLFYKHAVGAITLVSYFIQAAGDAEWLVNLEDDVHVLKPIDPFSLHYDINGYNSGVIIPEKVQKYITEQGVQPPHWNYGGCGGSVFRGAFLRMLHRSKPWIQQVRHMYAAQGEAGLGIDQVLSALVVLNGGSIGSFPGFAEMWYNDAQQRVDRGEVQVMHKNKTLYNAPYDAVAVANSLAEERKRSALQAAGQGGRRMGLRALLHAMLDGSSAGVQQAFDQIKALYEAPHVVEEGSKGARHMGARTMLRGGEDSSAARHQHQQALHQQQGVV